MTTANPDPATPFFTIVTATRNAAATLPSTLDSVSGQSYAAVEHIVVDGASTDGTQDLLRGRGGARLRWISEPDRNIAHAFNKGVEMAAGNVLLFLGADDRLADDRVLEDVAESLRALPRPWVVYGDCRFEYPGGVSRLVRQNFSAARFRRFCCLPHQATLVDRELFRQFGLFDESFGIAMDYDHLARFIDRHPPVYLPRLISAMSRGGVSTQAARAHREMNRVRIAKGWTTPGRAVWMERWAELAAWMRRLTGRGW